MKPKMILPVYHDTHDELIIEWVKKNLTTHSIAQGNGNIRAILKDGVAFTGLIVAVGAVGLLLVGLGF
jgi:hypothetical protein